MNDGPLTPNSHADLPLSGSTRLGPREAGHVGGALAHLELGPGEVLPPSASALPPVRARKDSAMALKEMRFSGTAKPCPSSGRAHT